VGAKGGDKQVFESQQQSERNFFNGASRASNIKFIFPQRAFSFVHKQIKVQTLFH